MHDSAGDPAMANNNDDQHLHRAITNRAAGGIPGQKNQNTPEILLHSRKHRPPGWTPDRGEGPSEAPSSTEPPASKWTCQGLSYKD